MGIVTKTNVIYICHPTVSGILEDNIQTAIALSRQIVLHCPRTLPITPYVSMFHYLDWNKLPERKLFIEILKKHFECGTFDEMWVCGEEITPEVEMQIEWCIDYDIPMPAYSDFLSIELQNVVDKIESQKVLLN